MSTKELHRLLDQLVVSPKYARAIETTMVAMFKELQDERKFTQVTTLTPRRKAKPVARA